jgi:hypothetical protein
LLFHLLSLFPNLFFSPYRCVLKRVSIIPLTGHFFSNLLHLLIRNGYQQHLIGLPTWLSICLSVLLSFCRSVHLSVCSVFCAFYVLVFVFLHDFMFICLSIFLSVRLSVCLSVSSSNALFYFFSVGYSL